MKRRKLEDEVAAGIACTIAEAIGYHGSIIGHSRDGTRYVYKRAEWPIVVPDKHGNRHVYKCEPATAEKGRTTKSQNDVSRRELLLKEIGKILVECSFSWPRIAKLIEKRLGLKYSPDHLRKLWNKRSATK
jgi:hypothetical protein